MISSKPSCSEAGHQLQAAQGHVQPATEYPRVEIEQPLFSSARILSWFFFFSLGLNEVSYFSSSLPPLHLSPEKQPGSIFLTFIFISCLYTLIRCPCISSPGWTRQASQPLSVGHMLQTSLIFMVLSSTHFHIFIILCTRELRTGPSTPAVASPVLRKDHTVNL